LSPRHQEIPAWDSLDDEDKALLCLQMENYADYLEHCDAEIGRLVSTLEAMGEFENTLFIYILGDNGSSAEGGLWGTANEGTTMQGLAPSLRESARFREQWGLPGTWPHFAAGWAWAGDTPFQWMKQVASHFGGTRNGMVVSWPAWIADRGATRFQFHHVIDIVPTLLEVIGLEPPQAVDGVTQQPLDGVSMAYTFDRENAGAKSRRTVQYFEMMGNRALYMEGWMASCHHGRLPWETSGTVDFAKDRWELYDVENDFSQSEDLAQKFPDKLRELQDQFLIEAAKYNVFPLDDRFAERADVTLRPSHYSGRRELTFYPGMVRIPEGSAPRFSNVNHSLTVHAEVPDAGCEGVLICMGGDMAGWSLFVDGDRLRYHYNWFGFERFDLVADERLPAGRVELRLEFECEDPQKRGGPAEVRLFCNGRCVAQGRLERQVPGRFSESLDVGEDKMSPVWPGYRDRLPFRFTGRLERIDVRLNEAAELTTRDLLEEALHAD
ncbi:MAG: sulfatase-like hydrolase/transferase, partial [Myxococcales bacterium]